MPGLVAGDPLGAEIRLADELAASVKRARSMLTRLIRRYPDAQCALVHRDAFELLIGTILSAQCTDAKVNEVTPVLFARYPDAEALASADPEEVEALVRPTGMFRRKAENIRGASRVLVERFGGEVPRSIAELIELPGVARKSANVVLGTWYGVAEGVVVDTHVLRLTHRMGWTTEETPEKVERDLMGLFPKTRWVAVGHVLTTHGRQICDAKRPRCGECPVVRDCPRVGLSEP